MSSLATPKICSASSRVGEMMMAPVPFLGLNLSLCSISMAGMRNESVLPEPVCAAPSTSLPAMSGGMQRACTSVMVLKPMVSMALRVGSDRSSVEKGWRSAAGVLDDDDDEAAALALVEDSAAATSAASWEASSASASISGSFGGAMVAGSFSRMMDER